MKIIGKVVRNVYRSRELIEVEENGTGKRFVVRTSDVNRIVIPKDEEKEGYGGIMYEFEVENKNPGG